MCHKFFPKRLTFKGISPMMKYSFSLQKTKNFMQNSYKNILTRIFLQEILTSYKN